MSTATLAAPSSSDIDPVLRWYSTATVRNSARIVVPPSASEEFVFPRSRQLIVDHPDIIALGRAAQNFILTQSAYKYMYEIGLLETRYVIDCALNIVNNKITGATDHDKREALTIVMDEGYHAYVALDFIIQLKAASGIEPIEVPQTNGNLDAVRRMMQALPEAFHYDFQLISVCLAEHTLTKDLLSIGKEKDATRSFTQVMTDHVSDEGRHANYFAQMMKAHWARLEEPAKSAIGVRLPAYLDDYLAFDEKRGFDRKVLAAVGLSQSGIERVIEESQVKFLANANAYVATTKANLVRLLGRAGILQHPATRDAFIEYGVELGA